ncbi:MAG: YdcF family protein [Acidobacteriota bacterium]|nr:YdcF family protein [Acidobacteriota bacterium]
MLPIGIILFLIAAGLVFRRRWLLVVAGVFLWLCSIPVVGNNLARAMESGAVRIAGSQAPSADAIVVLSGGRVVAPGPMQISEWDDPNRFFGGVELFQAGKAPLLIFTGGWSPYTPSAPLEGEVSVTFARALGVPADQVFTTGRVVNTLEESRAVAGLVEGRVPPVSKILLVTSAFHMPRAARLFEAAGFVVVPFHVDFSVNDANRLSVLDFVPTATALFRTQVAMRESYGRLVVWLLSLRGPSPDLPRRT